MKKLMVFIIIAAAMMCFMECDCEAARSASEVRSNQLTVHFNANGGSGTMSDITVTYEKETRLPICTFTPPTGKKFGYWNDQADGSGSTTLEDGEVYILHKLPVNEVTIYAIWINEDEVSAKYRIKFDSNGGSSSMADLTADEGQRVALPLCTFTPPVGKKFGHWNINADDSGLIKLPDGAAIDSLMSLPVTTVLLYAIWVDENTAPTIYTIHFDANGGSGTMADMTADSNGSITLPLCTLTPPTGKRFGYWNINADDSGMVKLPDGASAKSLILLPVSDIWLYAIWIDKDAHRIIYNNLNNVDNTLNPTSYKESDTIVLTDLTADGWSFNGWFDATEDGNKVSGWNAGERIEDVTLYARWTVNVYNIVYKDQGDAAFSGEHGADYPTEHTYNVVTNLVSPTKTGYDFGGWHLAADCADGSVTVIPANDATSDITLYAKWTAKQYQVTLKDGDATVGSITAVFDEVLPSQICPFKTGYTFGGYWTEQNGEGVRYIDGEGNGCRKWDLTSDISMWTQWIVNTYTVTLDNQGGTGSPESLTATYETNLSTISPPTKTGYTFGGYWTAANGKGVKYIDADGNGCRNWDLTSDTVLTAFFIEHDAHQIEYINNINNAVNPNPTAFKEHQNITIQNLSASGLIFRGWFDAEMGGNKITGWNAGERTNNITLYAKWCAIMPNGDMMINNVVCNKTGLQTVLSSQTTITCDQTTGGVFPTARGSVTLSPYSIGKYEVTRQLFNAVMEINLGTSETDELLYPIWQISWYDAITFCNKLSLLIGKETCYSVTINGNEINWKTLTYSDIPDDSATYINNNEDIIIGWNAATCDMTKNGYRLPTECEWECAARGGVYSTGTPWTYEYSGSDRFSDVAWYAGNSDNHLREVGLKIPNTLGLYDMSGNVEEWCWEAFSRDEIDSNTPVIGPTVNSSSTLINRMVRGGYCNSSAFTLTVYDRRNSYLAYMRSSIRYVGFRLAQSIVE